MIARHLHYEQWRALTLATLLLDLRRGSPHAARFHGAMRWLVHPVSRHAILYFALGVLISFVVWYVRSPFGASCVLVTYVMFIAGTATIYAHSSELLRGDDYITIAAAPVSNHTYLAARLAAVSIWSILTTTSVVCAPAMAGFLMWGLRAGWANVMAMTLGAGTAVISVLLAYTWCMSPQGAEAARRHLLVMHFFAGIVLCVAPIALWLAGFGTDSTATKFQPAWLAFFPPAWFASYVEIAEGASRMTDLADVGLSVLLFGGVLVALANRLSTARLENLWVKHHVSRTRAKSVLPGERWLQTEMAALGRLAYRQLQHDLKFRLNLLALVPSVLGSVIIGIWTAHSFAEVGGQYIGMWVMSVPAITIPSVLYMHSCRTDDARAAWLFDVSPMPRIRLLRATRSLITLTFIVPYVALAGACSAASGSSLWVIAVHFSLIVATAIALLEITILKRRWIPFSVSTDHFSASFGLTSVLLAVATMAFGVPIGWFVYGDTRAAVAAVAVSVGVLIGLDRFAGRLDLDRIWLKTAD